jgi:hypothetical protein
MRMASLFVCSTISPTPGTCANVGEGVRLRPADLFAAAVSALFSVADRRAARRFLNARRHGGHHENWMPPSISTVCPVM